MNCLCENCSMNYDDNYPCHEPHCCRDCTCFDECMEKHEDDFVEQQSEN